MLNYPVAYQSTKGSALDVDKDFYRRIATEQDSRELVEWLCQVDEGRLRSWITSSYTNHIIFVEMSETVQPYHLARRSLSIAR